MNFVANQKIQMNGKKTIKRTIVIRAQLRQMYVMNGINAMIKGGQSHPVLRWGECKKHTTSEMTRRMNVFQLYVNGEALWVSEGMIEESQTVMKCILASSAMNMYTIFYAHDFMTPLYQLQINQSKHVLVSSPSVNSLQSISDKENSQNVQNVKPPRRVQTRKTSHLKVSKSPQLPSLNSLNMTMPQNVQTLPSLKVIGQSGFVLPKLNY